MTIIQRYLGKTVISSMLMVLLVFIGLAIFISLVRQLDDIGTGEYGLLAVIEYVLLDLPQQIYALFPIASLIGIMLGLSILANHNELTILRASGISLNQIATAVLKASVILLIIAILFGEWLAPIAERTALSSKAVLTSNGQALTTRHGTWIRDGQNFIYIRIILDGNHLQGVSRYEFDNNHKLVKASHALNGSYENHQWIMQNVVTSKIGGTKIMSSSSPMEYWKLSINPRLLHIAVVDPVAMSLVQLYDYIHYLKKNNLNVNEYTLAFWQRIFRPLAILVMMLLAIPFVFGSLRKVTIGLRIVMGIMIGFIFSLANQFFGPLSLVYQWPPFIAALLPTLLFGCVAYWLLRRAS